MPELPDVEAARRVAERALGGKRIVRATAAADPIVFDDASPRRVAAALRGRRVRGVGRKGKYLWFELDERPWPVLHFGMTGSFRVYEAASQRPRFWKLELVAEDGTRLAMRDVRRFGRIRLRRDPRQEPPVSLLGFDPLEGMPSVAELQKLLARRKAPIKAVLLDQTVFAGVGNWMADEVLFQAGIRPHRPAGELSVAEVGRLRSRLRAIVARAVAVEAESERFPRGWLFHRRWHGGESTTARAEAIVRETIGGRTAAWVPARQR
ncbi:MAG TPA: DNA-formamidopyrimidine glycosylase family protein [Vicinamibacteria bacterium]|nr:DNA-formamidopyrimidine glycosylase family protein [Vicinamibacteria bacterium]